MGWSDCIVDVDVAYLTTRDQKQEDSSEKRRKQSSMTIAGSAGKSDVAYIRYSEFSLSCGYMRNDRARGSPR